MHMYMCMHMHMYMCMCMCMYMCTCACPVAVVWLKGDSVPKKNQNLGKSAQLYNDDTMCMHM